MSRGPSAWPLLLTCRILLLWLLQWQQLTTLPPRRLSRS
nr:MAG TPA: hypothetical protein [Caudoviricetes sp.]